MVTQGSGSASSVVERNTAAGKPLDVETAPIRPASKTATADEEKDSSGRGAEIYDEMHPQAKRPLKKRLGALFGPEGKLRPFRLLKQDIRNIRNRYISDWTTFNQLVFASAIYVFFTNILPGITFASDLYVLTGETWGTIEVVFSTGLCGAIFSL